MFLLTLVALQLASELDIPCDRCVKAFRSGAGKLFFFFLHQHTMYAGMQFD